tara:strand:+ start:25 stop:495 length:471 start_codon:yes stop_codon:yes gene_type:complete
MKIKGYEEYSIYEDGRVISHKFGKTRELKFTISKNGYKQVGLCKNSKVKMFLLHRLLAIHFIENPENKPTVDHENRVRLDNSLSNLRWYTRKEQNNNKGGRYQYPISKGCIYNDGKYYRYQWNEDAVKQYKYCKTLEEVQAFQKEHLERYKLQFDT